MDNDVKTLVTLLALLAAIIVGFLFLKEPAVNTAARTLILIEDRADSLRASKIPVKVPVDSFPVPEEIDTNKDGGKVHCQPSGVCWEVVK